MYDYEAQGDTSFIDLYLHSDSDQTRELNIIDNDLELFLQEIEIAVKIAPGEVWGIYENININRYVFNQYVTLSQVKNEISTYIGKNCANANRFPWTVDAQFLDVDGKKLLYIVVTITRTNDEGISENFFSKFLLGS
jgi:hypothetical protein